VTDRDGMYVHVTAKGAMSFRMDCQPMSWLRSTMQPSRPSRNGHPISTAFRFRSGAKDPERNTLRNAVINRPDGDEGEKSHFRDGSWLCKNAKTLNRDRRSYSSETALVAQLASEFNLEVELENIILVAFRFFKFLHSQGQKRKSQPCGGMSALLR
jgi:hypothetical protein